MNWALALLLLLDTAVPSSERPELNAQALTQAQQWIFTPRQVQRPTRSARGFHHLALSGAVTLSQRLSLTTDCARMGQRRFTYHTGA